MTTPAAGDRFTILQDVEVGRASRGVSANAARRPRVLYVTDLAYSARGRRYCDEDIALSTRLRRSFDIALCHPGDAVSLMDGFDVVLVRNSGPVIHYPEDYAAFVEHAKATGAKVLTQLSGKADMAGKQYLLDLYSKGYPVTPTIETPSDLHRLPSASKYAVKPKFGADSVGLRYLKREELTELDWDGLLVQPRIDFEYEVSFYFVDHDFHYALYTPDPARRWDLQPYEPNDEDLAFAQGFIDWNDIEHGVQRVDACRTRTGGLLLVELEDLNPYLSLDRVDSSVAESFAVGLEKSIHALAWMP
ncbi:hypothetical protein [Nesterenkonia aerolata]|uniref:ATP-grasp domain-containing protein n=1 Tax=Nesterenkonia aerolata TaxID=3074079 RepID=A0ABU2DPZ1_9MICC|nr:hypothetical protein [Nesterenkonia sp. LY-0111]MDR8018556.1 hypothetical protein [Nesterenkonia sp. LY-0111]